MNAKFLRPLMTGLLSASLCLQPILVRAEMVPTDKLAAQQNADAEREKVQAFLDRANVKERLQAMGIDGLAAKDRVAALSDAEVHALAEKIDTLPAGGTLSNYDLILVLLIAILVALVI